MATTRDFPEADNLPKLKEQDDFPLINPVSNWLAGVGLQCFTVLRLPQQTMVNLLSQTTLLIQFTPHPPGHAASNAPSRSMNVRGSRSKSGKEYPDKFFSIYHIFP